MLFTGTRSQTPLSTVTGTQKLATDSKAEKCSVLLPHSSTSKSSPQQSAPVIHAPYTQPSKTPTAMAWPSTTQTSERQLSTAPAHRLSPAAQSCGFQRRRPASRRVHILHLNGAEDDARNDERPPSEKLKRESASANCDLQGTQGEAQEAASVDEMADEAACVGAAEVAIHVGIISDVAGQLYQQTIANSDQGAIVVVGMGREVTGFNRNVLNSSLPC